MDPVTISILTGLTANFLTKAIERFSSVFSQPEANKAWKKVFLNAFCNVITEVTSHLDADMQRHVMSLMEQFFCDPAVQSLVIDRLIAHDELCFKDLEQRFNSLGFDSGTIPVPFASIMNAFFRGFSAALESELQNAKSPLHAIMKSKRIDSIAKVSQQIQAYLKDLRSEFEGARAENSADHKKTHAVIVEMYEMMKSTSAAQLSDGSQTAGRLTKANKLLRDFDDRGAESILADIRDNSWKQCSQDQKSQTLQYLARIYVLRGDSSKAAELFREACHESFDEALRFLYEGYALASEGAKEAANASAEKSLELAPTNEQAWSLLIQTAPLSVPFICLEERVPEALRSNVEVALGLSIRALQEGLHDVAEKYARIALAESPQSPFPNFYCAIAILTRFEGQLPDMVASQDKKVQIQEADLLLQKALELVGDRPPKYIEILLRGNRANTFRMLGKTEESLAEFAALQRLKPDDEGITFQYARILSNQKNYSSAKNVLAAFLERSHSDSIAALLIESILAENTNALPEAVVLAQKALSYSFDEAFARLMLMHQCIQLHSRGADINAAFLRAEIEKLPVMEAEAASAEFYRVKGQLENAQRAAEKAFNLAKDSEDLEVSRYIAYLLERCGLYRLAVDLWRNIVSENLLTHDTFAFLQCAQIAESYTDIIRTCRSLRKSGILHVRLYDYELFVLVNICAYNELLNLTMEYTRHEWPIEFRKYLNFQLSQLSVQLDKPELFVSDPKELPDVETTSVQIGEVVVKLLYQKGFTKEGQRYAYRLYRRFPNDLEAHRAIVAIVFVPDAKPEVRTKVEPGCAVYFASDDGQKGWLILEDELEPAITWGEIGPDDTRYAELLGKTKGENFVIQQGQVQQKQAKIEAILSKYDYRFNETISRMGMTFGSAANMETVNFGNTGDAVKDLEPLLKELERHAKNTQKTIEWYSTNPVPLSMLSETLGRGVLSIISSLCAETGARIFCTTGTHEEEIVAIRAFVAARSIVLDTSAVSTLVICDALDLLSAIEHKLFLGEGVIHDLQRQINECALHCREAGNLVQTEHGPLFIESKPEQTDRWKNRLCAAKEFLLTHCEIIGGSVALELPRDLQVKLSSVLPPSSVEAIALSRRKGSVLWSDDLRLVQLAREVIDETDFAGRVWTRLVASERTNKDKYPADKYTALTAKIMRLGFVNLSGITDREILYLLNDGCFIINHPSVQFLINWLNESSMNTKMAVELAGSLLKLTWQNASTESVMIDLTDAVLSKLSLDGNNESIGALIELLPVTFGLDPITAMKCISKINCWLRAKNITVN